MLRSLKRQSKQGVGDCFIETMFHLLIVPNRRTTAGGFVHWNGPSVSIPEYHTGRLMDVSLAEHTANKFCCKPSFRG